MSDEKLVRACEIFQNLHLIIETLLMKKIHLSIPNPCHQDWDAMTQKEKGRFCASCQKTVIDFTNMSDRQIAEFFKKPPASVCGRIYNDQLDRDIVIPKKRIPWFKYFFQLTWPAFALFLKSCGVKNNSQGKIKVISKMSRSATEPIATLGAVLEEIKPVSDTTREIDKEITTKGKMAGNVIVIPENDTVKMPVDTLDEIQMEIKPMDTVTVIGYQATMGKVLMGGLTSVCTVENSLEQKDSVRSLPTMEESNFKIYPNPVQAGSSLKIAYENSNSFPEQIQFISSSGQLILSEQKKMENVSLSSIQVPSNITAGIYFLRITTKNKLSKTTKVIVMR